VIELGHVNCFRIISKISQATGLRDPEYGCSLSLFKFLGAGCSGNHGRAFGFFPRISRPVWRHDCNLGQHPAERKKRMLKGVAGV
jgi:hypothetical protein